MKARWCKKGKTRNTGHCFGQVGTYKIFVYRMRHFSEITSGERSCADGLEGAVTERLGAMRESTFKFENI